MGEFHTTREHIIEEAISLIKEHGYKKLSVRNLATQMGCSTMPIYSQFQSIDELKEELRIEVQRILHRYQMHPFTGKPLLDADMGYVIFAREEPHFFRLLFFELPKMVKAKDFFSMGGAFHMGSQESTQEQQAAMEEIPKEFRDSLVRNAWIYTHGLALMILGGMVGDMSDADIQTSLEEAGEAFYLLGIAHKKEEV